MLAPCSLCGIDVAGIACGNASRTGTKGSNTGRTSKRSCLPRSMGQRALQPRSMAKYTFVRPVGGLNLTAPQNARATAPIIRTSRASAVRKAATHGCSPDLGCGGGTSRKVNPGNRGIRRFLTSASRLPSTQIQKKPEVGPGPLLTVA